ncbi:MAG: CvpA family protein [Clostridia bacterium]|nr:CvpA family protein [Clostridia bacterium]
MILDGALIIILIIAMANGKKYGLFRMITKLIAGLAALLATVALRGQVVAFVQGTALYPWLVTQITPGIEKALAQGNTLFLQPFIRAGGAVPQILAESAIGTILSVLTYVILYALIKLVIYVLDKSVFHLPLLKPINKLLGMAWNLVCALFVCYLVIGICGGLSLFSTVDFLASQMQSSFLVKYMYTHNILLDILFLKG